MRELSSLLSIYASRNLIRLLGVVRKEGMNKGFLYYRGWIDTVVNAEYVHIQIPAQVITLFVRFDLDTL